MAKLRIPLARLPLTDYEKELVRFCAKYYQEKGEYLSYTEFPRYGDFGRNKVVETHIRLTRFGLLLGDTSDSAQISPTVLEVVEQWDNPPPVDYRDWLKKHFWSKPWSMVIYAMGWGLVFPALVGWFAMAKAVVGRVCK